MTIKTRLIITAIITLGVALLVSHMLFSTAVELKEEIEESRIAGEILKGIFELNIITSDFLLYHEQRAEEQWLLRYDSISKFLQSDFFSESGEIEILAELNKNYQKMKQVFVELCQLHDKEIFHNLELEDRLASQLLLLSQEMASGASSLNEEIRAEVIERLEKSRLIVAIVIITFVLIIAIGIWLIIIIVMKPITKLRKGVEIVGQGNLKHKIEINSKDEIGELAGAFNEMAANLQKSRTNIEKQVKERTADLERLNKSMVGRELKMMELKKEIKKFKHK